MEERFTTYPSVMDLVTPSERLSAMPKSQKLNINNFKEKDDSELNENNNPVKIPSKPKIQKEKINLKSFFIPDLFKKEDIEELKQSYSPVQLIYNRIDNYFKRVVGVQFDSNMLIATAEFNINNLGQE